MNNQKNEKIVIEPCLFFSTTFVKNKRSRTRDTIGEKNTNINNNKPGHIDLVSETTENTTEKFRRLDIDDNEYNIIEEMETPGSPTLFSPNHNLEDNILFTQQTLNYDEQYGESRLHMNLDDSIDEDISQSGRTNKRSQTYQLIDKISNLSQNRTKSLKVQIENVYTPVVAPDSTLTNSEPIIEEDTPSLTQNDLLAHHLTTINSLLIANAAIHSTTSQPQSEQQPVETQIKRKRIKAGGYVAALHASLKKAKSDQNYWQHARTNGMYQTNQFVRVHQINKLFGRLLIYVKNVNAESLVFIMNPNSKIVQHIKEETILEVHELDACKSYEICDTNGDPILAYVNVPFIDIADDRHIFS